MARVPCSCTARDSDGTLIKVTDTTAQDICLCFLSLIEMYFKSTQVVFRNIWVSSELHVLFPHPLIPITSVGCFASAGWMTFRNLKERDLNSSGTLLPLATGRYGSLRVAQ
jgi:hypothetical protein